jgi:hypothetical protein
LAGRRIGFAHKQVNALPERTEIIPGWNVPISKFNVHTDWKETIDPETAKYHLDDPMCEDVIDHEDFDDTWTFTEEEGKSYVYTEMMYYEDCACWNRHFRAGAHDRFIALSELRKRATINDISARICVKGKVHYEGNAFYPICVKSNTIEGLFKSRYWNDNANEILNDLIRDKDYR